MSQSRISVNIHGQNVPSKDKLFSWLTALNPVAVLVMDEPGLAREIKDRLPDTTVIFRWNGDGGDANSYQRLMPAQWLAMMMDKLKGDRRIMLYTNNESGLPRRLVAWLTELIPLANAIDVSLCCVNLQTGNPEPEKLDDKGNIIQESEWDVLRPVLELLAVNRQHALGIHSYAGGVITSGLIGGNPTMIAPGEWPAAVPFTRWHLGREKFLYGYLDRHKIAYPRIIITEHGFDDTSDIKPYLDGLRKTPPYTNIRGWKTLRNQWAAWWPMWDAEEAYFEQLKWANEALYKGTAVEAQLLFCYGNSGGWEGFQIDDAPELQRLLVEYARQEPEEQKPVPTTPAYPLFPPPQYDGWKTFNLNSDEAYLVRPYPTQKHNADARIRPDEQFSYRPDLEFENEGIVWIQVKNGAGHMGWASKDVLTIPKPTPPIIEPPPEEPEPPIEVDLIFRQHREFFADLIKAAQAELEPLLVEEHALKNKIQKVKGRIAAYEMLMGDYEVLEERLKNVA
jgi:hypothetical protein